MKIKDTHRMSVEHDHQFSPQARRTTTKNRQESRRKQDGWDRKAKHRDRDS